MERGKEWPNEGESAAHAEDAESRRGRWNRESNPPPEDRRRDGRTMSEGTPKSQGKTVPDGSPARLEAGMINPSIDS